MSLNNFNPTPGSSTRKRRIGRGIGSGMGKTATRGTKGQKARRQVHPNFEGGQTPIQRRLPVKKGFRNINHKEFAIVNLDDLQKFFDDGQEITPVLLIEAGIIHDEMDGVKVLAFGSLDKKLSVTAHKFSKKAQAAIEARGGSVTVIPEIKRVTPVAKVKGKEEADAK